MNNLPQDFSMDFSLAPQSPQNGEFAPSFGFADTSEQFDFGSDPLFNFDQASWDLAVNGCIDPSLLTAEYPDPLTGSQTTVYPYPQILPNECDYVPCVDTLPLPSQEDFTGQAFSSIMPTPYSGAVTRPKPRKTRVARSSTKKSSNSDDSTVDLPGPLSQLCPKIPLVDAEAYIRRPAERRQAEWRARRDYPKMPRPVNAFLLYRRGMSEKAKHYAGVDNHQIISKITGASWQMESDSMKETFHQFAELEKIYHSAAFPSYRYNPKSRKGIKNKAKSDDTDESDEGESLDLPNPRYYQSLPISPLSSEQKPAAKSLKRAREDPSQSISPPPTKSTSGPRTALFARGSIKSSIGSVKSSTRQLSKRPRLSKRKVNYAEDSDPEDDEPVRTSKRRRSPPTADTIEVKW